MLMQMSSVVNRANSLQVIYDYASFPISIHWTLFSVHKNENNNDTQNQQPTAELQVRTFHVHFGKPTRHGYTVEKCWQSKLLYKYRLLEYRDNSRILNAVALGYASMSYVLVEVIVSEICFEYFPPVPIQIANFEISFNLTVGTACWYCVHDFHLAILFYICIRFSLCFIYCRQKLYTTHNRFQFCE